MNIQDALKPTGKAAKKDNHADYATLICDVDSSIDRKHLVWEGNEGEFVHYTDIFADDWQPYHEVKEISPEKAGELWQHEEGLISHTFKNFSGVLRVTDDTSTMDLKSAVSMIHGENGWTRLFPPVEDESVERIEIEGAYLQEYNYHQPDCQFVGCVFKIKDFKKIPFSTSMKMTLELPKVSA